MPKKKSTCPRSGLALLSLEKYEKPNRYGTLKQGKPTCFLRLGGHSSGVTACRGILVGKGLRSVQDWLPLTFLKAFSTDP